jgi:hypothetical protein
MTGRTFLNDHRSQILGIKPRDFCILLVAYLLAHGGLFLILNAIFWDDWSLYKVAPATILSGFKMAGLSFGGFGQLHVALLSIGPWIYRVLTFVLMFSSGLLVYNIASREDWISDKDRFLIALLFLILPFNWARVALIDFPYTLCYFAFFLAWWCIGKSRVIALALFFFSFNTNSLLVFFALPMMAWYLRENQARDLRSMTQWAVRRTDFMLLPFVYWFIKKAFYKPYGFYAGYNEQFSIRNLILSPIKMVRDFSHLELDLLLLVCLFVLFIWLISTAAAHNSDGSSKKKLLLAGIISAACGLFPYCVLGLTPTFFDWSSRHQLLMPLGFALLLTAAVSGLNANSRALAIATLVAICVTVNMQTYCQLALDWSKQNDLVSLFAHDEKIRNTQTVVFVDSTENAGHRVYRFYEWNGLMMQAFANEKRFGLNPMEIASYNSGNDDQFFIPSFDAQAHVRQSNSEAVLVKIGYAGASDSALISRIIRSSKHQNNYEVRSSECSLADDDKSSVGSCVDMIK